MLVVDDEDKMRNLIRIYLRNAGFEVLEASDGLGALAILDHVIPHVVILDIMMPIMDGMASCEAIRRKIPEIPIIMLTARTSVDDKVEGLTVSADDYITKPFDGRELVARVQALLRRAHNEEDTGLHFEAIQLSIDLTKRQVTVDDKVVTLTPKEFELTLLLVRHPGRTFPREEILERVWPYEYEGETRTVDSHVKNIREKLKDAGVDTNPIKTVWGVGYKFEVET